jgi:methylenetetrahydrofolate dehydrogenase (NADP+) / methenyltetrahydrofolate cyclohydrolase
MNDIRAKRIIDCVQLARAIDQATIEQAQSLVAQNLTPTLAVVYAGETASAASYRRQITRQAGRVGIRVLDTPLGVEANIREMDDVLTSLNEDESVHGVLVQTPLSGPLQRVVQTRLSTDKDPEGVTPRHLGMLFLGKPDVLPCTPAAILAIIHSRRPNLLGARVVVVNGSSVIGRPLAMLLIEEGATPTICTEQTRDLAAETSRAEVLVVAAGKSHLIGPQHLAQGAVVIDAGVNQLPNGDLAGDVDLEAVLDRVAAITPVPKGVGPVTTAKLLSNVVALASLHRGKTRDYA